MIPSCMSALPEMPGVIPTEAAPLQAAQAGTPMEVHLTEITTVIRTRSRIRDFRQRLTISITDVSGKLLIRWIRYLKGLPSGII